MAKTTAHQSRGALAWLARAASLLLALNGALRFFSALRTLPLWQQRAYPAWVMPYLILAGALYLAAGLIAYILLLRRPRAWLSWLWLCTAGALALYWMERMLLWVPAERGGNLAFVAAVHLLWLLLLALLTCQKHHKEVELG